MTSLVEFKNVPKFGMTFFVYKYSDSYVKLSKKIKTI